MPVRLESDISQIALAEQWFGHGRGHDHCMVVAVDQAIGAGNIHRGIRTSLQKDINEERT